MKYTVETIINKPKAEVVGKFDSTENLKFWMRGLKSFETIKGEPGTNGSISKVVFETGKRKMQMTETILDNSLPDSLSMSYQGPGVFNINTNRFEAVDENRTKYSNEQEFQFKSLAMKIFGWLMPSMFKKQSMIYMNDFKAFVEVGKSVLD